jgi:plastocyanin domain-containing protein
MFCNIKDCSRSPDWKTPRTRSRKKRKEKRQKIGVEVKGGKMKKEPALIVRSGKVRSSGERRDWRQKWVKK